MGAVSQNTMNSTLNPDGFNSTDNLTSSTDEGSYYQDDDYQHRLLVYNIKLGVTYACYSLTILLGILGNVLVIYTIWRCRHLHTVMYTLLASLSVADLIMVMLVLPWRMHLVAYYGPWLYGDFLCRFPDYLYLLSSVCSVFHLTVISLERCYAVTSPLKSRTVLTIGNAYRMTVVIWTLSAAASIPLLLCISTQTVGDYILCRANFPSKASQKVYALYLFLIVFGIPMTLIIVAYGIIFKTLRARRMPTETAKSEVVPTGKARRYQVGHSTKKADSGTHNGTHKLNKSASRTKEAEIKQMTIMLVVVVSLFAMSWGPKLTLVLLKNFEVVEVYSQLETNLGLTFDLMAFMNSAANPIVYALVSPSFRESCKWALKVCCKSRQVRRRPSGASRAMTVSRGGHTNAGTSATYVENVSMSSSACAPADKI